MSYAAWKVRNVITRKEDCSGILRLKAEENYVKAWKL